MLFNSYQFVLIFLPACLTSYLLILKRYGAKASFTHLVVFSIAFYSYWNPSYGAILIISMVVNFYYGKFLLLQKNKFNLAIGVSLNLLALGYYKYFNFFADNFSYVTNTEYHFNEVVLPLAISFFTFQQIAYLVDSYRSEVRETDFIKYALFVTFFPQLIAGPIVHHKEMLPQFSKEMDKTKIGANLAIGLSIFAFGLFKKTVIADGIAEYATPIFAASDEGEILDFFNAWGGALAYSFQLYFDFSGYSDMAVGIARMFGIVLPLNFYSPYKSTNISQFWRRWHMTLSRFLRDYVYIPLGGNRKGSFRKLSNLMITMLLGGLWHGAGWNFVIWGGLHGLYLIVQSIWSSLIVPQPKSNKFYVFCSWLITMLAVIIAWVFFRAETYDGAINMLCGMLGVNGVSLPNAIFVRLDSLRPLLDIMNITSSGDSGWIFLQTWVWIIVCLAITLISPNTQDIFSRVKGSLSVLNFEKSESFWPFFTKIQKIIWQENSLWAFVSAVAITAGGLTFSEVSEFLYFQF